MKRTVTPEQFVDLAFPLGGVADAAEYAKQEPLTARFAANVRGEEPAGRMVRGGSRCGLSRYIDDPVSALGDVVQHLDVVVDPQAPRLWAYADDETYDATNGVLDVSTNNLDDRNPGDRYYPAGGSGVSPNVNIPATGSNSIVFVQKKGTGFGNINSVQTVAFDAAITNQNLGVVVVGTSNAGNTGNVNVGVTVTNGGATAYTQAGSYVSDTVGGVQYRLSVWYKVLNSGADDNSVKITPGATVLTKMVQLEYAGADATSPLANTASATSAGPSGTFTAGSLTLNGTSGQLVLAAFIPTSGSSTQAPGSSYTPRADLGSGTAVGGSPEVCVEDRTGVSGVGPETPSMTASTAQGWVAMAAGFTR